MNLNFSFESLKFLHIFGGVTFFISCINQYVLRCFKIEGIIAYFGICLIKSLDYSKGIQLEWVTFCSFSPVCISGPDIHTSFFSLNLNCENWFYPTNHSDGQNQMLSKRCCKTGTLRQYYWVTNGSILIFFDHKSIEDPKLMFPSALKFLILNFWFYKVKSLRFYICSNILEASSSIKLSL